MRRRHPKHTITREIRTRRALHPGRDRDELEALRWPESLRVGDFMTRAVVTIQPDRLARDAVELMRRRRIRHLPVVDHAGQLVGIVTDRDLRQIVFDPAVRERLAQAADALRDLTVREIMTWGPVTVSPDTAIVEAARMMHERKIGALPVLAGGRVMGILTERDVLRAFRRVLTEGVVAQPYRWALTYR